MGNKLPTSDRSSEAQGAAPPAATESLAERFGAHLQAQPLSEYDATHAVRLSETLHRCEQLFTQGVRVLELGGLSLLSRFLIEHEGIAVAEYTEDLRKPLVTPSASQDVVLMLEVLEHLNDYHTADSVISEIAMFTGSGARCCLREVKRVLAPGGHCVLTTPNAISVDALGRVLLKRHPFQYPPHVREYAPDDVAELAREAGFEIVLATTFFSWNALPGADRGTLLKLIADAGYDPSDRGDDMMLMLRA